MNALLTYSTRGSVLDRGPSLCVRKFVPVMAEAEFPEGTLSR